MTQMLMVVPLSAVGYVYLIHCDPHPSKSSHMLVLIDLLGYSDDKTISAFIFYFSQNIANEINSSTTGLSIGKSTFSREEFKITYIGSLAESIYLLNPSLIPSYRHLMFSMKSLVQLYRSMFDPASSRFYSYNSFSIFLLFCLRQTMYIWD